MRAGTRKRKWVETQKLVRAVAVQIRNAFCATGEGGGVDPTCPSGDGKSSSSGEPPATRIKKLGFNTVGLKDVDESVLKDLHDELKFAMTVIPTLSRDVAVVRTGRLPPGTPAKLNVEFSQRELIVDPSQLTPKILKEVERSQKNGFLASGGGLRGLIAHEIGHAIDKAPFAMSGQASRSAMKAYIRRSPPTAQDLSRYAFQDKKHEKEEVFAEAYAAYRTKTGPVSGWQEGFNAAASGEGR